MFGKGGGIRRIATSIPPALTFRAVANSRNSFPLPSRLRTNTGIASGSLVHLRRSFLGRSLFMNNSKTARTWESKHIRGQNSGQEAAEGLAISGVTERNGAKQDGKRMISAIIFSFCLPSYHAAFDA